MLNLEHTAEGTGNGLAPSSASLEDCSSGAGVTAADDSPGAKKLRSSLNRRLFAVNINIAFSLPFAMTSDFATFWANFNSRQQEREAIATQQ